MGPGMVVDVATLRKDISRLSFPPHVHTPPFLFVVCIILFPARVLPSYLHDSHTYASTRATDDGLFLSLPFLSHLPFLPLLFFFSRRDIHFPVE